MSIPVVHVYGSVGGVDRRLKADLKKIKGVAWNATSKTWRAPKAARTRVFVILDSYAGDGVSYEQSGRNVDALAYLDLKFESTRGGGGGGGGGGGARGRGGGGSASRGREQEPEVEEEEEKEEGEETKEEEAEEEEEEQEGGARPKGKKSSNKRKRGSSRERSRSPSPRPAISPTTLSSAVSSTPRTPSAARSTVTAAVAAAAEEKKEEKTDEVRAREDETAERNALARETEYAAELDDEWMAALERVANNDVTLEQLRKGVQESPVLYDAFERYHARRSPEKTVRELLGGSRSGAGGGGGGGGGGGASTSTSTGTSSTGADYKTVARRVTDAFYYRDKLPLSAQLRFLHQFAGDADEVRAATAAFKNWELARDAREAVAAKKVADERAREYERDAALSRARRAAAEDAEAKLLQRRRAEADAKQEAEAARVREHDEALRALAAERKRAAEEVAAELDERHRKRPRTVGEQMDEQLRREAEIRADAERRLATLRAARAERRASTRDVTDAYRAAWRARFGAPKAPEHIAYRHFDAIYAAALREFVAAQQLREAARRVRRFFQHVQRPCENTRLHPDFVLGDDELGRATVERAREEVGGDGGDGGEGKEEKKRGGGGGGTSRSTAPTDTEPLVAAVPRRLSPGTRAVGKTLEWTVVDRAGVAHKVCYDAIKLYLWETSLYGPSGVKWRDPTFRTELTGPQVQQLKDTYRQLSRCSARLQQPRVMQYAESPDATVRLPHEMWVANLFEAKRNIAFHAYRLSKPGFGAYAYAVAESEHDGDANTLLLPRALIRKLDLGGGGGGGSLVSSAASDTDRAVLVETCFELPVVRRMELRPESRGWAATVEQEGSDRVLLKISAELEQSHRIVALGDTISVRDDRTGAARLLRVTGLSDLTRAEAAAKTRAASRRGGGGGGEGATEEKTESRARVAAGKVLWNIDAGLTQDEVVDLDFLPARVPS